MFNNMAAIFAEKASRQLEEKNSVCEMGNQTLAIFNDVVEMYKKIGLNKKHKTAKDLYELLGFKKYVALDVNDKYDSIIMDLNYNLKDRYNYNEQFDLVTNIGTSEHIFNQATVFENIHNLCKKDGIMFHILPAVTGWVDHGFYNYNPNFFTALAKSNDYKIIYSCFGSRDGKLIETKFEMSKIRNVSDPKYLSILQKFNQGANIGVIMRKNTDKDFRIPIQEYYSGDIQDADMRKIYGV